MIEEKFSTTSGETLDLRATLISTTNTKFEYLVGTKGSLKYKINYSAYFDNLCNYLWTSVVNSIELEEHQDSIKVTLHTLNSVYVFSVDNKVTND